MKKTKDPQSYSLFRLNVILWIFGFFILAIFIRLFILQVLRHEELLQNAIGGQTRALEIEAERGGIYAFNGERRVPLVLNEARYNLIIETRFYKEDFDQDKVLDRGRAEQALSLLKSLGVDLSPEREEKVFTAKNLVILAKNFTDKDRQRISQALAETKIDNQRIIGIYFKKQNIRQYLEGTTAAPVLGFLDGTSEGRYGIEQRYNDLLTGTPGWLERRTDVNGVPLVFIEENIAQPVVEGEDVTLTLDVPLQRITEKELAKGVLATQSQSGIAMVMDADTGAILSMADYPSFDPANFQKAKLRDYLNDAVESILEPGSTMKVFSMAAALNEGVFAPGENYYNPLYQRIDGHAIRNFVYHEEGYIPVEDILSRSLNTGSTEMLKRFGGDRGSIDLPDREILHRYYANHFMFNRPTGINLPGEISGFWPEPSYRWAPNHLYATMTFGQSVTVTPLQLMAAYAALFNGGTYYQPQIVRQVGQEIIYPQIIKEGIITPEALSHLEFLMDDISKRNLKHWQLEGIKVSGKTGSAQTVDPEGGYLDAVNGLMFGYLKSSRRTFIIGVIVYDPQVRFAGSQGAQPIWEEIIKNLIAEGKI